MSFTLQNDCINVLLNEPGSEYNGSRFDWTGQVRQVMLKNGITFCGSEKAFPDTRSGIGLSCEFGIDMPIGYDDCALGDPFIKIGIGFLTKDSINPYDFSRNYKVTPASFSITRISDDMVSFRSFVHETRGYGFDLQKLFSLHDQTLTILYTLKNTGRKSWSTTEYCHNFISIGQYPVDEKYTLYFPEIIGNKDFEERYDPFQVIDIVGNKLTWKTVPSTDFFLRGISGLHGPVEQWEIFHASLGAGIRESCDFIPYHCNLWGNKHVISPELFKKIDLPSGEQITWQRTYSFFIDNE